MSQIVQRRRDRIEPIDMQADLMPLIDMVFILLIFFMLSSTFLKPVIQLTLPTAITEEKSQEKLPTVISIDKVGVMYINQEKIERSQLHAKLSSIVSSSNLEDLEIIFSADKSVDYAFFIQVVDELKQFNIHKISLEHD